MPSSVPAVSMRGIHKRFGDVEALSGVDFDAHAGAVNAVIGENGAGKTTLVSILYGLLRADRGRIEIEGGGALPRGHRAADAIASGLGMLQQNLSLIPTMSAVENIVLGREPRSGCTLDYAEAIREAKAVLSGLRADLDVTQPVGLLPVPTRQMVEIARLVASGARILIFDEPTAALAPDDVARFYGMLRAFAGEGKTVILITHRLGEVLRYADHVTVLRRGSVTCRLKRGEFDEARLIGAIVPEAERDAPGAAEPAPSAVDPAAPKSLRMENITCAGKSGDVRLRIEVLEIARGEILAVAGVSGGGQRALAEAACGLRGPSSGTVFLDGADVTLCSNAELRRRGVVYIPEDRTAEGVLLPFSLVLNRLLGDQRRAKLRTPIGYRTKELRRDVEALIAEYDIDAAGPDAPMATLSGGNQQKFALARELERGPRLVIAHNPARGLDIGATRSCYRRLISLAAGGAAVMLIGGEINDLLRCSHHVAVLFGGRLFDAGPSRELDARKLGLLMTGGSAA